MAKQEKIDLFDILDLYVKFHFKNKFSYYKLKYVALYLECKLLQKMHSTLCMVYGTWYQA